MSNPYLKMPRQKRNQELKLIQEANAADAVIENIAAATALKWAHHVLTKNQALGPAFPEIKQQAFPRPSLLARPADFSETEVDEIISSVKSALATFSAKEDEATEQANND